jgi:RsiW-degrading membrane proteinase PrsW (M82 family)/pSer/pThr/pTyr-binding forkhead associated (FHA) protein
MSVSQSYGVLRIVHMRPPAETTKHREKDLVSSLPQERLVHLLTRRETTIGRALSSDLILWDPAVSRSHARLVFDDQEWHIYNITEQNSLYVNGCLVSNGESIVVQPQDFLLLGNTVLQLIAPQRQMTQVSSKNEELLQQLVELRPFSVSALTITDPQVNSVQGKKEDEEEGESGNLCAMATCDTSVVRPPQSLSERRMQAQRWQREEERLFRAESTMQFVLSAHSKQRTYWIIGGVGIAILLLSALVVLILNNVLGISTLVQDSPLNVLAIVTIPIIPALGIGLLVNLIDRFEREPWFLRLAAFLWGAIIAIPPTLLIEQYIDALRPAIIGSHPNDVVHAIFAGLNAGVTEETVKGLGLLLLFMVLRNEFDNVTDGIVYGALIGAGFAMVENFSNFSTHPKSLVVLLIGRIVLGWLSHSTFTACFGAALGYIRHTRVRWQHIVIPLTGYIIAVGLHSVFDFVNFFASSLVSNYPTNANVLTIALIVSVGNYLPQFIAQMVILYCLVKSLSHEASIIREFLAEEVSNTIVTVDEYALLQHSFLRKKIERRIVLQRHVKLWMRVRELYRTEIELAFCKWHASMGEKGDYKRLETGYRHRIQHLRQDIRERIWN